MIAKPSCVIVDDEESALAFLRDNIEELKLLEIERVFLDPNDLLDDKDTLVSQIFFLDIEMGITGIEIAKELKGKLVIFVSGHNEYVADVVDIEPVAFVQKPVKKHKLKKAILKALEALKNRQSGFIVLKTDSSSKEEIKQEDIVYMKSDGRDKEIHLSSGNTTIAKNIKWDRIQAELSEDFLQVNPKNIVNIKYVNKLISADLIGVNHNGRTVELSLTNSFKKSFFEVKPHLK